MTRAYTLYKRYTLQQLTVMLEHVMQRRAPQPNSSELLTKKDRDYSDALTQAITWKLNAIKKGQIDE